MLKKNLMIRMILIILVTLLGNLIWNEALLYSQNNLFYNSKWEVYKKNFYGAGANAVYGLLSRTTVAGNHLFTNKNLGHHIVFSKENVSYKEIDVVSRMQPEGFLDILFNFDGKKFNGFRIGQSCFFYEAKISGEYTEKISTECPFSSNKLYKAEFKEFDGYLYFTVNHQLLLKKKMTFLPERFGFYTSLQGLEILNFSVRKANGKWEEVPFTRDYDRFYFFSENLLIFSSILTILALFVFLLTKKDLINVFLKASVFLALAGLLWFGFDFFYYSRIPKIWNFETMSFESDGSNGIDFEKFRYRFFKNWFVHLGGTVIDRKVMVEEAHYYNDHGLRHCFGQKCEFLSVDKIMLPQTERFRVAYMGGSFAAFSGVVRVEDAFFDTFAQGLNREIPLSEVTNFVYSGILLREKKNDLLDVLHSYKPKIAIISFYLAPADFAAFDELASYCRDNQITLFYYSALAEWPLAQKKFRVVNFSPEYREMVAKNTFWGRMKTRKDLYYIDAEKNFNDSKLIEKGLIWWDSNHMSPYGQAFIADDLLKNIILKLKKKGPE